MRCAVCRHHKMIERRTAVREGGGGTHGSCSVDSERVEIDVEGLARM